MNCVDYIMLCSDDKKMPNDFFPIELKYTLKPTTTRMKNSREQ